MENDEAWIVYPLEDRNVREIVLPREHVADLRRISRSGNELTGLLHGVIRGDSLYSLGYLVLGEGNATSCSFDPKYKKFHNELMRRTKLVQPSLTSILYHNHPRLPLESCPEETVRILEQELKSGVFDYLQDYGVSPTIHEAIAEQSRQLSEADVNATFGRMHVLVTDTGRAGSDFSHINAYKFGPGALIGNEMFRVVPLSGKSADIHSWAGGVCSSLKKVYEDLRKESQ
ncbi:MAG: hypothetical protein WC852_01685 [Candidatus Nanoarchaeia archaeon]|jgi:hypothetical protein